MNYFKCTYEALIKGSCNNQNFGRQYCYYHRKVDEGLIRPESTSVTLSSMPSHSSISD